MAMTIQAKRLRQVLKDAQIKDFDGRTPSVNTERIRRKLKGEPAFYEFGLARAYVMKCRLTAEQIETLRRDSRVKIYLETENCLYLES